jgi:hypothetical protein
MGPQIPVGVNPQKPFANRRKDGCLHDGVGVEIVQLHPVEMQNRPHETTCWHSEPPLMERDETQHIPRRWGRGGSARRGHPLRLRVTGEGTKQAIGNKGLQIVHRDGGERPRVARRNDGYRSAITKRRRWRWSGQGSRFSFCGYSLRLRKPKREASSRVKNHHRSLFRIYKGPGETHSTLRPNPPQNSKLEGETPVPRTARATAAPRTTRLVALTLRQGTRHLWQAKQATLHLRHDDRVKKGMPRHSISYHFPLPLSLSCYRDRERGYSERDPSLPRKRAPSPLLIRGSKAGPSEGFDSRLIAPGLRAQYWSGVRRLAPRKGSTAASCHSGSAPTTDQGFVG